MLPTTSTSTWKPNIPRIWAKSQSAAEWRLPFALFICALLAYAAAFAWHMLTTFDLVNLIRDVNFDDSFYYFQIAYNLAQGKFSTFDGGITQTNGYHPVWLLLITPFYWIFDKETALFGIKALEIMLVAGGAALIAAAAWVARLAWPLLFAALPMLYHYPPELLGGVEAAVLMFTLSLLILAVCLYMRDPPRWKWSVAAIAFALPWVRIEYIAVSLAVTAALFAIEWSRQERRSLRLSALANIRQAHIPLLGAMSGMLVYFAYNGMAFGGILPVSVATKYVWAQGGEYSLVQNFWDTLRISAFDYELLIALEICAYLLIVWRLALRSNKPRDWLMLAFLVGVFGLAARHIGQFAQFVIATPPALEQKWYFVHAYIMTALIIPVRLYIAIYLIRRFIAPRRSIAAGALTIGVFVIGAALLLARSDFAEPFKWVDGKSRHVSFIEWEIASYMGMRIMNRALPEGSVIGSWDAGAIGYFSRFPVVNLDGLVNSYDYFHARHIRQAAGVNFYRRYGVTHFANNQKRFDEPMNNKVVFEGAPFYRGRDFESQFRVWTYDPPPQSDKDKIDHSHQVWDNLKPHFDYFSDGVGIVLAGRTAQAFIKDCPPDEPLIWTWQEHGRTAVRIEANTHQSLTGMCIDALILPHSATQPAQAKMTPLTDYFANLTAAGDPIIRSDFDVYISGGSLIYTKPQCGQADVEGRFFANIFPVDADVLPARLRQRGYETIDFSFTDYGAIAADGRCWAALSLPNYPIAEIHAGQYVELADGYAHIWEGAYRFD